MLLVRRNNDSNWLNNWFDDTLFDVDLMPQTKATAPAINVLETPKDYKMEMAVPGLRKEWVRVNIMFWMVMFYRKEVSEISIKELRIKN